MLIVQSIFRPQAMNNVLKLSTASQIINKRSIQTNCQPFLLRSESQASNSCQIIQNHKILPPPWMCNLNSRSFSTSTPCSISKSPGDPKAPLNMFLLFAIAGGLAIGYELIFGDGGQF